MEAHMEAHMEMHVASMELHRIPWKSMEFQRIP